MPSSWRREGRASRPADGTRSKRPSGGDDARADVLRTEMKADARARTERRRVLEQRDVGAEDKRRRPVRIGDDPAAPRDVVALDPSER